MFKVKPQKWPPTPYMRRAVKMLVTNHFFGLLLDPGLRKTSIVLKAFATLKAAGVVDRMLVVAPLRVCYNVWPAEVEKWTDFNHLRAVVLHGDDKDDLLDGDYDIFITNPDSLPWLLTTKNFKKLNPDILVVDESTNFKHPNTGRFKLIKKWLHKFAWRWILTGTPVPNGLQDLFGQIYVVDRGRALGAFITHFRDRFFQQKIDFYGVRSYELLPGAEEKIQALVKPITLRLEARDYIELPEMIVQPIWVDLPPKARRVYDEMEKIMITELDVSGARVVAVNKGVAYGKCAQIANGGLYYHNFVEGKDEDQGLIVRGPRIWEDIHSAKDEALSELIDSLNGGQLLVSYAYAHDLARIAKVITPRSRRGNARVNSTSLVYLGGGVSPKRGKEIEDLWNHGKIQVLPGHPQAMAHGLNMQYGGNHIVWYAPTDNLEHWEQFNLRIIRSGSKHKHVFVHPILARNTVDEIKFNRIESKDRTAKGFSAAIKTYIQQRRK